MTTPAPKTIGAAYVKELRRATCWLRTWAVAGRSEPPPTAAVNQCVWALEDLAENIARQSKQEGQP